MALERDTVRCPACELVQFRRCGDNACRRCGKPLRSGSVESTTVILMDRAGVEGRVVRTMRDVMQIAAVQAVQVCGGTTRAAKALGIPHSRVKQLLRETGDVQDYRRDRKARRVRCQG